MAKTSLQLIIFGAKIHIAFWCEEIIARSARNVVKSDFLSDFQTFAILMHIYIEGLTEQNIGTR